MIHTQELVFWLLLPTVLALIAYLLSSGSAPARKLVVAAITLYAVVVAGVVLSPLPIDAEMIAEARRVGAPFDLRHHNFVPFRTITAAIGNGYFPTIKWQLGGNIALFVPLGLLLPLLHPRFRSGRDTVVVGLAASLLVETIQLLGNLAFGFGWKAFDVDDLFLNTAGTMIGWLVWRGSDAVRSRGGVSAMETG